MEHIMLTKPPEKQIRAFYTPEFIRVYQAYGDAIVKDIEKNGTFSPPSFSLTRMTWIKPSFCWMMYRSGWGYKDAKQNNILAIDITHEGFLWCLQHAMLSKQHPNLSAEEFAKLKEHSPVVIQWDPERDIQLNKLDYRSIQIGIKNEAVEKYVNEWIVNITNITSECQHIKALVDKGEIERAKLLLPDEQIYPINQYDYPYLF